MKLFGNNVKMNENGVIKMLIQTCYIKLNLKTIYDKKHINLQASSIYCASEFFRLCYKQN